MLSDYSIHGELDALFPSDKGSNASIQDHQYQPASVDLRLGSELLVAQSGTVYLGAEKDPRSIKCQYEKVLLRDGEYFELSQGMLVVGTTSEYIAIPPYMVGYVEGKSSLGRLGVNVHVTARFLDPGFHGNITLEIGVIGPFKVNVTPGISICQVAFAYLSSPAQRPYGHLSLKSKYQGQVGATPCKV